VTELLLLAVAFALVLACGGFVAAEFAFVTVDRGNVDRAAEQGDKSAQGVQSALRSLSTQLSQEKDVGQPAAQLLQAVQAVRGGFHLVAPLGEEPLEDLA
jgi:hypothetical protein